MQDIETLINRIITRAQEESLFSEKCAYFIEVLRRVLREELA